MSNNQIDGNKYAIVVGISDYMYMNDLKYCDDDAVLWCDYLSSKGYTIYLFGDGTNSYGSYVPINTATEVNVRKCVHEISEKIVSNDKFVFIDSGHGSSINKILGISLLCMVDANNIQEGLYYDTEFADDIKSMIIKNANVIIFTDACFSGGFIDNIMSMTTTNACILTTCTQKGYGYDVRDLKQGAWTYYLLIKTLMSFEPPTNLLEAYKRAIVDYPYSGEDTPQIAGNGDLYF